MPEDDTFAAMWQRLMVKWETAQRSYQTAREAEASLNAGGERNAERDRLEAKALEELQDIKRQIDELIAEGARRHQVNKGSLVIGTIEDTVHSSDGRMDRCKNR